MRWLCFCGLFLLLGSAGPARHSYHATITELRYNAEKKQVELAIKVFVDDFERALSQGQPAHISLSGNSLALPLTESYLHRTVTLKTPTGSSLPLQFLGMQPEKDAYWLYCKAVSPRPLTGLQLRQAVLLDVFSDQMNIVNVEAGAKKLSALFRAGHEQETLNW